jgi:5-methylthioadenosine/S-adenosylhomocysteine deaminase
LIKALRAATILTMRGSEVIENGDVIIEGDVIVDVGKAEEVRKRYPTAEEEIDCSKMILLPGLVNGHTHTSQILVKGIGLGKGLMDWLPIISGSIRQKATWDDMKLAATASMIESVRSGCTTMIDNVPMNPSKQKMDDLAQLFMKHGFRAVLARGLVLINPATGQYDPNMSADRELKETEAAVEAWHRSGEGLVTVSPGPSAIYRCNQEIFARAKEMSDRYHVPVHTHIAEVQDEVKMTLEKYSCREIEILAEWGVLGPLFQSVHSVWLSDEEISILAQTKTNVMHNPSSNLYLGSGVAPIPRMLSMGVNVTLGTDGSTVGSPHDMLEMLKLAGLMHRVNPNHPAHIEPWTLLQMATVNGAKSLGREHDLGTISKGKQADLFTMRKRDIRMNPIGDLAANIVYYSNSSQVDTVIIKGKVMMRDSKITFVNEESIIEALSERGRAIMHE